MSSINARKVKDTPRIGEGGNKGKSMDRSVWELDGNQEGSVWKRRGDEMRGISLQEQV